MNEVVFDFIRSLVWADGVIRLTEKSLDIILKSTNIEWDFQHIYDHAGFGCQKNATSTEDSRCLTGIPFETTLVLIYTRGELMNINLYKRYPSYWAELMRINKNIGIEKVDKEILETLAKKGLESIAFNIFASPHMTLEIALRLPHHIHHLSSLKCITLQMMEDHPNIQWYAQALYNIKITDENIDAILNHQLLTPSILSYNRSITIKHAWMIAEKLAEDSDDTARSIFHRSYLHIQKPNEVRYLSSGNPLFIDNLDILPPDWNGRAQTLSWKVAQTIKNIYGIKYVGRSKRYTYLRD